MQSFNDANLRCCECQGKFSSASALLHHFARHALEKQGNKLGEGNFSRYDWQPWRYDDIFKTKRKGHNFLETALLSINETCRKRAKLHAATPVSTSSENSSHSLTGKSEMSEAETKGGERSQDDNIRENQCLSNSCKSYSKCSSKVTKENPNTSNSSECKNTLSTISTDNSKNTSNIIKENKNFSHKIECSSSNKIPLKFKLEKSNRISIVEESEKLLNNIDKILPKYANNSLKGINNVEENLKSSGNFESSANKCSKKSSKLIAKHSKSFSIVEECQDLKNVSEKGSKCSVEVSTNKFEENNVIHENLKSFECSIEECRKTSLINSGNESRVTKNEKYKDELLENTTDGSELVKIVKIEKPLSINNDCIVGYSGPEPNMSPKSVNLELPLELRTSKTCFNRSNDVCDVVYDNDDNNLNLGDSLGKVNCDNNNVIIHYNDNSQCELPKIISKRGREVVEKEEKCEVVEDCGIEEGKRKLSNRKQTTPKKIERIENEFLKIAPRPDNLPRDDRGVSPNKKGAKKKYCCPLCSRVFGWSTDLKRHILVHTGERPFKCSSCTSSFTRKFLLQKHQNKMHPLNGKTERERLLELKVSENLKELKSKMLELQKSKESNYKNGTRESNYKNGSINTNGSLETQNLEDNNGDEEIDVKLEPPYETFFKIEHDSDENWDSTSNNNNNNNNEDIEMEFTKVCKKENIVFVEPIVIQSS